HEARQALNEANISDSSEFLRLARRLSFSADLSGVAPIMHRCWHESGVTVGTGAVEVRMGDSTEHSPSAFSTHLTNVLPWLRRAVTAADIRRAKSDGVHALYGYYQPVAGLPKEHWRYEEAYFYGLRMMMLTYNQSNGIGCGCTERVDHGLTGL